MEFQVSAEHVRRQTRMKTYVLIFCFLELFISVSRLAVANNPAEYPAPLIGLLVGVFLSLAMGKQILAGKAAFPVVTLDEDKRTLTLHHQDLSGTIDLTQLASLRLQRKSGKLASIVIKTGSGQSFKFEGYENLDQLATSLERLVPGERTSKAAFFHR